VLSIGSAQVLTCGTGVTVIFGSLAVLVDRGLSAALKQGVYS
jgi:hypothetical protein